MSPKHFLLINHKTVIIFLTTKKKNQQPDKELEPTNNSKGNDIDAPSFLETHLRGSHWKVGNGYPITSSMQRYPETSCNQHFFPKDAQNQIQEPEEEKI